MKTDSAGEDGDDLGVSGHLRSEEYHRYEYEQRTEHIHKVRNEIHIIIEDDGPQRRLLSHEIVDSFTDIEDYDNAYDQDQRHEEGADELPDYIQVNLSWSEIKLHFLIVL
mgnify:FL=1